MEIQSVINYFLSTDCTRDKLVNIIESGRFLAKAYKDLHLGIHEDSESVRRVAKALEEERVLRAQGKAFYEKEIQTLSAVKQPSPDAAYIGEQLKEVVKALKARKVR